LQAAYHGVILAYGAETDRPLGVPGEQLLGSHAATEFVGWYNGHPDFQDRHFDLKTPTALIIGQGNVAADVARILLTPVDDLRRTDITAKALEALSQSQVKTVVIVGRRGPAQAKFTPTELQELGKIQGCKATINPEQLNLNAASLAEISQPRGEEARKNIKLFEAFCTHQEDAEARRVVFQFLAVPTRINGDTRVHSVTFNRANLAGNPFEQVAIPQADKFRIEAGLVFRCVGYSGTPIAGVDFDQRRGTVVNEKGRCKIDGKPVPGLYVTGWIKRGPSGTIGTNRADSVETVATLLEDLPQLVLTYKSGRAGIRFTGPNSRPVSWADWELIDAAERAQGALTNKPREKLTSLKQMLRVLEP
jgi:ferredoxin--NADP+ reductase